VYTKEEDSDVLAVMAVWATHQSYIASVASAPSILVRPQDP
jgi:hypothetical protein